jgi:hypothetical protein
MAIDGLGSNTPFIPPPDVDPPPANKDGDKSDDGKDTPKAGGPGGTSGPGAAGNVTGSPPVGDANAPTPPIVNVISPAVSAPKPNSTPLDRPKLVLPSQATSLSVGDLIILVQQEIQKTSEALAVAQNSQIKQDGLKQQAANNDQIKALNDAAEQIKEAQEMQDALDIANWCIFAVTMLVCAFTFGVASPMLGLVALTQVPIEGKNLTGWITEGMTEGLTAFNKAIAEKAMEDKGFDYKKHGYSSMDEAYEALGLQSMTEETSGYEAMAIEITAEIAIAIIVSVCTFGIGAPAAAGGGAAAVTETTAESALATTETIVEQVMEEASELAEKTVETTVEQTIKAAEKSVEVSARIAEKSAEETTQVAEKTAEETTKIIEKTAEEATNLTEKTTQETAKVAEKTTQTSLKTTVKAAQTGAKTAAQSAQKLQKAFNLVQTIGSTAKDLAMDGAHIDLSIIQEKGSEASANADKIRGYVKFLQQILKQDQEFLKELIDMQANIADTTKGILQTEHSTNMHIANLTTHA